MYPDASGPLVVPAVFDHVALAAPRLRDLIPFYVGVLGGRPTSASDDLERGYRVVELGLGAGTKIELMEPLRGSTFFDRFFAAKPDGGVHHVTFVVPDLAQTIAALREQGWEPMMVSLEGRLWREAFLHPRTAHGALIQLAETDGSWNDGWEPATIDQVLNGERGNGEPSP